MNPDNDWNDSLNVLFTLYEVERKRLHALLSELQMMVMDFTDGADTRFSDKMREAQVAFHKVWYREREIERFKNAPL